MNMNHKNLDKNVFEKALLGAYHGMNMNLEEIAKTFDTTKGSISYYMDKFNIPINTLEIVGKEKVEELYSNGMTQKEIGEKYSVSTSTVNRFFEEKNINARTSREAAIKSDPHPSFVRSDGYNVCQARTSKGRKRVYIHRLIAYAHFDGTFDEFENKQVHHRNKKKFDNRPENLEVLSGRQHQAVHHMDEWVVDNGIDVLLSPKYAKEN